MLLQIVQITYKNPLLTTYTSTSSKDINHPAGKFSTFYGPQRFIAKFTWSHHYSLPRVRQIQSTPSQTNCFRAILKLSSHMQHLCIVSELFPSAQGAASLFLSP